MSAINLRNVKRDFSQLNFRPDIYHPDLINELSKILVITGLKQDYDVVLSDINTHSLINIIKNVCEVCNSRPHDTEMVHECITFLAKIYTKHCVDDTIKRTVTKCLKSCPENCQPELYTAISSQFISIMNDKLDLGEIEFLLKTLNECCDKFPNVFFNCREKVFEFFEFNLRNSYGLLINDSSPTEKISAMRCIHEAFRFFLTAVNKRSLPDIISPTLNKCFMDLLDSDSLPMETLFNCCISIVHLNKENIPALECWKLCLNQLSTRTDLVKLGFCLAILSTFTNEELRIIELESEKSICFKLYNIIMDNSVRNMNDTSILLSSSRVILLLSKQLFTNNDIGIEKSQLEYLITFLWLRMDHYLDGVRHMARDTMTNIIKIKDEHVLNEILKRLSVCDKNSKAFYIVLTILSDKVDCKTIIKYLPNIAERLLQLMRINNSAITIFIHLMVNHYSFTECKLWFNYWLLPLFKNTDHLDIKHLERIITKAVEITPDVIEYINELNNENELSLKLYLICLNIQKNVYLANNDNGNWITQSNFETLKKALHNNDENIRFLAVNLILDCKKKSQSFLDKELELMKYFIIYNNKYEKSSINQKHLSFIKKMLFRIKESQFSVTVRTNETLNATVTENYSKFRCWFIDFCFDNLFADANFFRRNFFLQSLRLIQTSQSSTSIFELSESIKLSILINCIWDTYEQNKILAKDILLTYKNQEPIKLDNLNSVIEHMLQTSKMLSSSINPQNSVTAGYLLEVVIFLNESTDSEEYTYAILSDLVNELKKEVELAEKSLTLASAKGPMYGTIHTIRHLINTLNWQDLSLKKKWVVFIENISEICLKCEKLVSIVVNDSSPEGIVPMDDLYRDNCQVTSQMVLLCCWRTTKESSLLLGDVVGIIGIQESSFSNNLITKICSCLTLLLSETKHRGAFEQIYVAYLKVCSVMWKSPTLYKIPIKYLEDVLEEIKTGLGETFCVTRRSAGMPFIIQALLCTNHDNRKVVNHTMEVLINICENKNVTEDLKVGVVHALNVLRTLFRCSQLADLVGPFVARAITISVILFNSSSWPIRNSSTLLLSTLVNRIFGVPRSSTEISWENCMSGQLFFRKYPELYDVFLTEFKKFSPMDMRPSLYPTLLLVGRLYPSVNEEVDCTFPLSVYIPYIFKCAQSPVMKTRMLAATSIAPQVTTNKFVEHFMIIYNELMNKHLRENTIHGLLLQMFSLVEILRKLEIDDLNKLVILTHNLLIKYDTFNNYSYVVQEVFLRCITYLWIQLDDLQYNSIENFYKSTLESVTNLRLSNTIGASKYLESAVLFLFSISIKTKTDFSIVLYNIMKNGIQCRIIFEILYIILSGEQNELYVNLRKFKNILNYNYTRLKSQFMANEHFIELFTKKCTIIDSLIDMKYLVLSIYPKALYKYFTVYQSIDNFIFEVSNLRKDAEISQALLCINRYLSSIESLDQHVLIKLSQIFEDICYEQRSDDCKIACIDIIISNYSLFINENLIDIKIFLKLWTIIVYYSEDNSENVRKKVWCLIKNNTNCAKSFELLFEEFGKHFDKYPSAVLIGLICWSYLDIKLPQDRLEGQVFDGGDTSEFKEFTIRQSLMQNKITDLTNKNPGSLNLEINEHLQEWIIENWTCDIDIKPNYQDLRTVENFLIYAKEFYSRFTGSVQNIFVFNINK